jgi:hypothetical protein
VTHEYPHDPTFDSVTISRVMSLGDFGLTQRQREFLVTVMVHAGCFLERQYCTFTGTARGQNSREFVARLVARGFARAIEPGRVRRGRLYYVHHKPLYEAIGQPDDRNRRLHSIGRMVERVMILDAVMSDRRCWWLSPEGDKRTFFDMTQGTSLRPNEYPHITFASGSRKTVRCFPDKLPIGIEKEDTSRFVLVYLVNRRVPVDFRQFLIRHQTLLLNLHKWTLRLLVPRRFRKSMALYKAALREELWTPLNPSVSKALETYFSRAEGAGPSPRKPSRSLHREGVPPTGDGQDHRPVSSLAPRGRHGAVEVVIDEPSRRSHAWLLGLRNPDAEWPVPATHGHDGPRSVGQEGGEAKIASGWPPVSTPSQDVVSPLVAP